LTKLKVTILGCGSSGGVPQLDDRGWGECDPENPKNRRRRASILVQSATTNLLVDTSPDMRQQLLDAGVNRLDGVFFTHSHADHTHGIDDIRWINVAMNAPIPAYGQKHALDGVEKKFAYAFAPTNVAEIGHYYKPTLERTEITDGFDLGDTHFTCFEQWHGFSTTTGIRMGDIAYSTDVVELDDKAFAALEGLDVWIVDCFCRREHKTHAWLDRALEWIDRAKPRRAVLTHMGKSLDYDTVMAETPENVVPAYDGLVVETD
jgi:phosphoribosyl 1,2-cyclic phosphate phosphodiesterase